MKSVFPMLALVALCGCATHGGASHILTGTARAKTSPEQVKVYLEPPAKYEVLGMVSASAYGDLQSRRDKAVQDLKTEASKIGANGIIMNRINYGDGWASPSLLGAAVTFDCKAVYVLESDRITFQTDSSKPPVNTAR